MKSTIKYHVCTASAIFVCNSIYDAINTLEYHGQVGDSIILNNDIVYVKNSDGLIKKVF